jgi:hypothetical protein
MRTRADRAARGGEAGSGKGTVARQCEERIPGLRHVDMGGILRSKLQQVRVLRVLRVLCVLRGCGRTLALRAHGLPALQVERDGPAAVAHGELIRARLNTGTIMPGYVTADIVRESAPGTARWFCLGGEGVCFRGIRGAQCDGRRGAAGAGSVAAVGGRLSAQHEQRGGIR